MIFSLQSMNIAFPAPELAEEDGLLAVGGDLSPERLLLAYRHGIFPWYSDDTPILWYSPHQRFVLFPDRVRVRKSMRQIIRSGKFSITKNTAFAEVITACASVPRNNQPGTWIIPEMQEAYIRLHQLGFAHSIEVWEGETLVGGLFGVAAGQVFCGESMFSKAGNASKAALIWLAQNENYRLIDCQMESEHLKSMGAETIGRNEYMQFLVGE